MKYIDPHSGRLEWHADPSTLIGVGCSSMVYIGKLDNIPVAIKQLEINFGRENQFRRELDRYNRSLTHPNVVNCLGWTDEGRKSQNEQGNDKERDKGGKTQSVRNPLYPGSLSKISNHACIILEFVPGGSLRESLEKISNHGHGFFLDCESAYRIAVHIARAMLYIHNEQLSHGDLRSHNVLLTEAVDPYSGIFPINATAKVFDFGLSSRNKNDADGASSTNSDDSGSAALLYSSEDFSLAQNTVVKGGAGGFFHHLAPEVLQANCQGLDAAKKADIYSYGILLSELLIGISYSASASMRSFPEMYKAICLRKERPSWDVRFPPHDARNPLGWKSKVCFHMSVLRDLAEQCWLEDPCLRPNAQELVSHLQRAQEEYKSAGLMPCVAVTPQLRPTNVDQDSVSVLSHSEIQGRPETSYSSLSLIPSAPPLEDNVALLESHSDSRLAAHFQSMALGESPSGLSFAEQQRSPVGMGSPIMQHYAPPPPSRATPAASPHQSYTPSIPNNSYPVPVRQHAVGSPAQAPLYALEHTMQTTGSPPVAASSRLSTAASQQQQIQAVISNIESALLEGTWEPVVIALSDHPDSIEIRRVAMPVLASITAGFSEPGSRSTFVQNSGMHVIMKAIEAPDFDFIVVSNGIWALGNVIDTKDALQRSLLLSLSAPRAVVKCLETFLERTTSCAESENQNFVIRCALILEAICADKQGKLVVGQQSGGIQVLLQCIFTCKDTVSVLFLMVIRALFSAIEDCPENAKSAMAAGIEDIMYSTLSGILQNAVAGDAGVAAASGSTSLDSFRALKLQKDILSKGFQVFGALCVSPESQDNMYNAGGLNIAIRALQAYESDIQVCESVSSMVYNLVKGQGARRNLAILKKCNVSTSLRSTAQSFAGKDGADLVLSLIEEIDREISAVSADTSVEKSQRLSDSSIPTMRSRTSSNLTAGLDAHRTSSVSSSSSNNPSIRPSQAMPGRASPQPSQANRRSSIAPSGNAHRGPPRPPS